MISGKPLGACCKQVDDTNCMTAMQARMKHEREQAAKKAGKVQRRPNSQEDSEVILLDDDESDTYTKAELEEYAKATNKVDASQKSTKKVKAGGMMNYVVGPDQTKAADDALLHMMMMCCTSVVFDLVEKPAFKEFCAVFGYKPFCRKTLSNRARNDAYGRAYQQAMQTIRLQRSYQLDLDGYSKSNLDNGFKMVGVNVNLPKGGSFFLHSVPSNGESVNGDFYMEVAQQAILQISRDTGLDVTACTGIVTDGEATPVAGMRTLQTKYPHLQNLICQGHSLALVLKECAQYFDVIKSAVEQSTVMVQYLAVKTAKARFTEVRQHLRVTGKYPSAAPGHRFGYMVDQLEAVQVNSAAMQCFISCDEWAELKARDRQNATSAVQFEQAVRQGFGDIAVSLDLLKAIREVLDLVESDRPSASQLMAMWGSVRHHVDEWAKQHHFFEEHSKWVSDSYQERYNHTFRNVWLLAESLDPLNAELTKDVSGAVLSATPPIARRPQQQQQHALDALKVMVQPEQRGALKLEWMAFTAEGFPDIEAVVGVMEKCAVHGETGRRTMPSIVMRRILWGSSCKGTFPLLSDIAQKILGMHSTSCSLERVYSRVRALYSDQRSCIGRNYMDRMMFYAVFQQYRAGVYNLNSNAADLELAVDMSNSLDWESESDEEDV
jgi:hypothetical protein